MPTTVTTRRHWYGTQNTRCDHHVMPRNITVNAQRLAMPAPTIPYGGMSRRLSVTLTTAALPVTTQLNCVRFVRPRPMETTMKPPKATAPKASSATTSDAS